MKTADVTNPLKSIVDEAMKDSKVKNFIKHVFVAKRTDRPTDKFAHDVNLDEVSILSVCIHVGLYKSYCNVLTTIGNEYSITGVPTRSYGQ